MYLHVRNGIKNSLSFFMPPQHSYYFQSLAEMLRNVTKCYEVLRSVTKCYEVLRNFTKCYEMLRSVTKCYEVLRNVTKCYEMLQNVTKCYEMLRNVTICYQAEINKIITILRCMQQKQVRVGWAGPKSFYHKSM